MKNITLFLLAISPFFLSAQEFIKVEPDTFPGFAAESVPVFKVEVERVSKKAFMDNWQSYLEKQSGLKVLRSDNEILLKKAVFKTLDSKTLNVYLHFQDMVNGTRVFVAFEDTVSGFISPSDPKYGVALNKLVYDRTKEVFFESKKNDLKTEEDVLKDLENSLDKVIGSEDKINKNILSKRRKIDKLKNDIEINKSVLSEVNDEVATQRSNLNAMSSNTPSEVRKNVEKELKKQESKREKLSKNIDRATEDIYDEESEIRDLTYELEKIKQDEELAKKRVNDQRALVLQLRDQIFKLKK